MKNIAISIALWSLSSCVLALPFNFGANTNIRVSNSGVTNYSDGGDGVETSHVEYDHPSFSLGGEASAVLDANNISQPMVLRAKAGTSLNSASVRSEALAIQRFRFTGTTATTITATGNFNGKGTLISRIALISAIGDMDALIPDFNDRTLFNDLGSSNSPYSALTSVKNQSVIGINSTTSQSHFVSLLVNPNDEFFLLGDFISTVSDNFSNGYTGERMASYTLDNINDLVAVSAVPVPAAVWLMGSAMLGLFGFKRKAK